MFALFQAYREACYRLLSLPIKARSGLAAVACTVPIPLTTTCCLQGSTDAPSRQQRINSTASKVCRSLSKQRSRSRSPALVREAVHDRPRCTEDSIAMHSKASKPCHAVSSLPRVLSTAVF